MTRRLDPDPFSIFAAIVATYAASVATVNFVKSHYRPLPTQVRAKLVFSLTELDDHTKRLRADVTIIEDIFRRAEFPTGRTIRLGNGAFLTQSEFSRYEEASDNVIRRLREIHKLSLRIEREATKFDALQMAPTTNVLGDVYSKLDRLLEARDLTLDKGWEELRAIAESLERVIAELRKQLGGQ